MIPRVLSIAGTDPTGGAGLHADLKTFAALGAYGMGAVTALVAQNTQGVREVHAPPVSFLRAQLDAVSDDVMIDAVKIGMLGSVDIAETVRDWLRENRPPVVVLDPVMVATSGYRLLDADCEQLVRELAREVDVVTPNVPELAVLAEAQEPSTWEDTVALAGKVAVEFGVTVIAKGGHLDGEMTRDAVIAPTGEVAGEFSQVRLDTTNTHGTGCSLSSALAALRPHYDSWVDALEIAQTWLHTAIEEGAQLQVGRGHGPVDHMAFMRPHIDAFMNPSRDHTHTFDAPQTLDAASMWWNETAELREQIDGLPFVVQLGDGSLRKEPFMWYIAQDALYLRDFSRALAAASELAPTRGEQEFFARSSHEAIAGEMQLHDSWLGGASEPAPSAATTAYTNHLLAAVARGDYAVLVAALLPCYWLYSDIGKRLHAQSHPAHPYASWLETYAEEGFEADTNKCREIANECFKRANFATRQAMGMVFVESSRHEYEFFKAPLEHAG